MFQQSLIEGTARTNKSWSVALSIGIQTSLIGTLLLIPMLNPELLPKTTLQTLLSAPAPPPGPPPPPAAPRITHAATTTARPNGAFVAPRDIPRTVAMITDDPPVSIGNVSGECMQCIPGGIGAPTAAMAPTIIVEKPPVVARPVETERPVQRVRLVSSVQEAMLISRVQPIYPQLARQTHTEGTVRFTAIIGRDGSIQNLTLISGHPLLNQAAADAVRRWRYRPTILNGEPVEVVTEIEVHFILH